MNFAVTTRANITPATARKSSSRKGFHPFVLGWLLGLLSIFSVACNSGNASSTASQQSLFTNAPGSPISVTDNPGNVLLGDMNNDGKLDLILGQSPRTVLVMAGKGNGQFGAPLSETTVPDNPGEIALGDVNGDGNLDVAIASHDSYGVVLLLGDGKGGLAIAPSSPIVMKVGQHPHTHGLAVVDVNRDKKLDIIIANNADNDISIALGDGRGNFTRYSQSPFPVGPSPYPFAVGDVNNDGWPDIAATATATGPSRREQLSLSRALTLLLSDGKDGFTSRQLPLRTGEPWFAAIADLNDDGNADIVATHHEKNEMTVLIGDGRGAFREAEGSPFDFGVYLFHIVIADVNRDGKNDVVATTGNSIRVILGDGRGGFTSGASAPVGRGAWRLAAADINGDGRIDVVTSNFESKSVSVLLGS